MFIYRCWKVFAEDNARVNTLHLDRILLILEKGREYLKQLLLRDLGHKFDHVVQDDGSHFAHLRNLILRDLNIHRKQFLLTLGGKMSEDCGNELSSRKL